MCPHEPCDQRVNSSDSAGFPDPSRFYRSDSTSFTSESEHLLLALAEDADGVAGQILERFGVRSAVKAELAAFIQASGPSPQAGPTTTATRSTSDSAPTSREPPDRA